MRVPHPFAYFAKGWEALHSFFTMPRELVRYQQAQTYHFLTFSCYGRKPLLNSPSAYDCFEQQLEAIRQRYQLIVAGYVLMPEHVHLLVNEPRTASLSIAIQVLKQQTSRKLSKRGEAQFWQRRYYDFNVWSEKKTWEKLQYMHRNPVKRGLGCRAARLALVQLLPLRYGRGWDCRD
jgi:putative transposase